MTKQVPHNTIEGSIAGPSRNKKKGYSQFFFFTIHRFFENNQRMIAFDLVIQFNMHIAAHVYSIQKHAHKSVEYI